jgi:hypothetical protein
MSFFVINLLLAGVFAGFMLVHTMDGGVKLPFLVSDKEEPFQTFLQFLVRFGPLFSGLLGANLALQFLLRLVTSRAN